MADTDTNTMSCMTSCCCLSCIGCTLKGIPKPPLRKLKKEKERDAIGIELGSAKDKDKDKDKDTDDVHLGVGLANGVHFSFNYCLFCSFTPLTQS